MGRTSQAAIRRREEAIKAFMALPVAPENPDRVRGPKLGARVRYVGRSTRRHGQIGTVTQRSYVWAPDKQYGEYRGIRRYDDSVVTFDDGVTIVIDDHDLEAVLMPGDRVRVVRDTYHGSPIAAGTLGTVQAQTAANGQPYMPRTTHATSNGGGYEVRVLLDDGRQVYLRAAAEHDWALQVEPVSARLDYLRSQLEAERISYYELSELQSLANEIDPFDVQLLEAAGIPEDEARRRQEARA